MPVCPVCRSQNMESAKFCGNCGNPFPRTPETTSSLRKCEQGHIYSAVYQNCPYCPQGVEAKREANSFETRIEEIPSFVDVPTSRPAVTAPTEFATRIDAPAFEVPSFNAPPLSPPPFTMPAPPVIENDLATRIETPIPSEFITRIETPLPGEMVTRIEEPMKMPPTFDLTAREPVAMPPAPLPRTELLQDDTPFVTRIENAPIPPSALDLDWPTPPPNTVFAPPPPLNIPATPTVPSMVDVKPPTPPVFEVAPPLAPTGQLPSGNLPTGNLSDAPISPTFASVPPMGNRGTMVISTEEVKKSLSSKGKLVGWLVSYARNPDGEDFKLHAGYNRLGANPACDIVLDDDTVSGSHAIIVFRDGRFLIKDDLSRNGTYVNNKEVTEAHPLQSYDQIRFGNTVLTFVAAQKL
ncbi:MAG: FHA domain-containing protein [Acidobacteria bacterium]|nr:FHA domain-containing protein [Acidobacteriota bacterium]